MLRHNEFPWMSGDLRIASDALDQMHQQALDEYPNECCGYASGPAADLLLVDRTVPMKNLAVEQAGALALPEGRTGEDYFVMDPLKLDHAIADGDDAGQPVKVIYHSHPNGKGGYFSAEDRAMFGEGRELSLPVSFIVIGLGAKQDSPPVVIETRLWVFNALTKAFEESSFSEMP